MAAEQQIFRDDTSLDTAVANAKIYVHAGGQTLSGNNDYSGVGPAILCEVNPGFTGQGFTAGSPMTMAFVDRFYYGAGAGDWYWTSTSSGSSTTNRVFVVGGGTLHIIGSGTTTGLHQRRGTVNVPNGHIVTNAYLGGGSANLYDTGSATAVTALYALGSNIYCQRPLTAASVESGSLMLDADSAGNVNSHGTISVVGGTLTIQDCGEITSLQWRSGRVNFTSTRPVTIAACSINFSLPGAKEFANNPLIYFEAGGPTALVDDGRA